MSLLQSAKQTVLDYTSALDNCANDQLSSVIAQFTDDQYLWRGMHPFNEQHSAQDVADVFWQPMREAFAPLQRRPDVFLAGGNALHDHEPGVNNDARVWVCSMGHFFGLFDKPWLDIPPTGKMVFIRYAEFNCVQNNKIIESALFCDVISIMQQAGQYPLPPHTGAFFMHPGPLTHDGLLIDEQDSAEAIKTLDVLEKMVADLNKLNVSGDDNCPPELLARTWNDDMIWYGPAGIGSSYTIPRYQKQHQYPFRENLKDKVFNGHIARFAEGNYACFFGWPNLNNTATGGFLGMTGNDIQAEMRVVDVYRRDGDKLAENWVFIDIPHYLSMQGLDVLERMRRFLI